jgi:Domain of unknown function (DUF3425)
LQYIPVSVESQYQQAWWNEDKQMVVAVPVSFAKTFYSRIKPVLPSQLSPASPDRGSPTGILFPLSSDHLITLIQYNVLRACLANLKLLNLVEAANTGEECGSPVLKILTDPTPVSETGKPLIPPHLEPTTLQRTVEHAPWIDIIPHPVWRDNLIRASGTYSAEEICNDVVGGLWDDDPDPDILERGVIAWSPPWDISGWEVSEGFLKKWGWILRGCDEVLAATNRWRRMRGEDDLVVEV